MSAKPADTTTREQLAVQQDSSAGSTTRLCATCHQPLLQSGRAGACVRCLANFLAAPDDDFAGGTDAGALAAHKAARYGHFEILTDEAGLPLELGHGSMGTTYRAHDTVLQRTVALKVIEQSVAALPAARQRFLREARAAARFQHPGVAAVSHYGEQDGECYYVMELVEGETLEAWVRREGPLPTALALEIAIQISQALVAAETLGVVHRDLKPSNLMLPGRPADARGDGIPLVKVIDFGLAKAVDAAAQAMGPGDTRGGFVGTPAFASPEQFRRSEDFGIDHRADIYSLGATMWYALCGRSPFVGRTLEEVHARQSEPLPTEQLTSRGIPRPVVALLVSALALDPADRPQSARELLDRLQRCQADTRLSATKRPQRTIRWWLAAAAVLAALSVAVGDWWMHRNSAVGSGDRSLAVLPFGNASPNPDDAFYTTGVQDEITADLARVAALKVVSPDSSGQYPPGSRDFRRIGSELGVRYLLTGRVRREHERVKIEVRLVNVAKPTQPWVATYDRQLADVFLLPGEVARTVAGQLQTPLSHEEKAAIDLPPTTDEVAYDLYLRAQGDITMTAGEAQARKVFGRGLALLEQATQRDPKFALAYCAIAHLEDELSTLHLGTPEERAVDHRARAESALENARRLRPDDGEVHLALARHLVLALNDVSQAKVEIDLARRTLPNNADVETITAFLDQNTGRWDDAIRARERAVVLNPRDSGNYGYLEQTYRMLRRYDAADRTLEQLLAITPPEEALPVQLERAVERLESRADLAPLRAALAAAPPGEGPAEVNLFRFLLAYFDRDPDGLARALAAAPQARFRLYDSVYPKAWFEGLNARLRGNPEAARAAFTLARAQAEEWSNANPTRRVDIAGLLAMTDAALGRRDQAVDEALQVCENLLKKPGAEATPCLHCDLAVVYAWTGQPDLALTELETWTQRPAGATLVYQPTYGDLKLNPMWDPLRNDARFGALVERLAPSK